METVADEDEGNERGKGEKQGEEEGGFPSEREFDDRDGGGEIDGEDEGGFEDEGEGAKDKGVGAGVGGFGIAREGFGGTARDEKLAAGFFAGAVIIKDASNSEGEKNADEEPGDKIGFGVVGIKEKEVRKEQGAN